MLSVLLTKRVLGDLSTLIYDADRVGRGEGEEEARAILKREEPNSGKVTWAGSYPKNEFKDLQLYFVEKKKDRELSSSMNSRNAVAVKNRKLDVPKKEKNQVVTRIEEDEETILSASINPPSYNRYMSAELRNKIFFIFQNKNRNGGN